MPGRGETEDQEIHVDCEHLFEHAHLPPHYLAVFLPAAGSGEFDLGQTAFLAGSHKSDVAKAFVGSGSCHKRRYAPKIPNCYVVRPHCQPGDVLIFDARILHFGIVNSSSSTERPLLFVNYHRPWFSDIQQGGEIIVRHK